MPSDIVLDDDEVRVEDGSLAVEDGDVTVANGSLDVNSSVSAIEGEFGRYLAVVSDSDRTSIYDNRVFTSQLHGDTVYGDETRTDTLQIGTGSPNEPTEAGSGWVNDERGTERIYFNGGRGDGMHESSDDSSGGSGGSSGGTGGGFGGTGGMPWRTGDGWQNVPPEVRNRAEEVENAAEEMLDEQVYDERSGAPETVRVYVEGDAGSIGLGGDGVDGDLVVTNGEGETVIHLDGDDGDIAIKGLDDAVGAKIQALEDRIAELESKLEE